MMRHLLLSLGALLLCGNALATSGFSAGSGSDPVASTLGTVSVDRWPGQPGWTGAVVTRAKSHPSDSSDHQQVIIGHNFKLEEGETQNSDLVLIGSQAEIRGTVNGDVVLVGSGATIQGTVNGDLVSVASKVNVEAGATINGDYVTFLSSGRKDDSVHVNGDQVQMDFLSPGMLQGFHHWFAHTVLLLRPMSLTSGISWFFCLASLASCLAVGFFLPRPVAETSQIIQERAPASVLAGIAVVPATAFLCFLLLLTVIGILAIPLVLGAVLVFSAIGNTALFQLIGKKIAPHLGRGNRAAGSGTPAGAAASSPPSPDHSAALPDPRRPDYAPLGWICVGAVVCWILYLIPVIGFLASTAVFLVGLGAFTIYLLERTRPRTVPATPLSAHQGGPVPGPLASPVIPPVGTAPAAPPVGALPVTPPAGHSPAASVTPAEMPAEFLPRLLANLIDIVLLYTVLNTVHLTRYTLILWALYRFGMYVWRSATLGEIILGLQVRRQDGGLLSNDTGTSALRALASLISLLPLGLGFIWILFDPQKQAWHDKISRSYLVRTPAR